MTKWWIIPAGAAVTAAVLVPARLRVPRAEPRYPESVVTIDDAVAHCRDTGRTGWDLVEYARMLTHRKYSQYSILTAWESRDRSFAMSRGFSSQYNGALAVILTRLGFEVQPVFATRVRTGPEPNPWWRMGHSWLRVQHDGRWADVCAYFADGPVGAVTFVPVTEVRTFGERTRRNTVAAMSPFVLGRIWRAILTGSPLPRWSFRAFGEPIRLELEAEQSGS